MSDYFKENDGTVESDENNPLFSAGISATDGEISEQAAKCLEVYKKMETNSVKPMTEKLISMQADWLNGKELLVMYTFFAGKLALTPIVFGASEYTTTIKNSNVVMRRAPNYEFTRLFKIPKEMHAVNNTNDKMYNAFLNLAIEKLVEDKHISKLQGYGSEFVSLAGCIIVDERRKIEPRRILSVASSEVRAAFHSLMAPKAFVYNEPDMNHLNHKGVETQIDITTDADAKDLLGNNIFSPIKVTTRHKRANNLSGEGTQLMAKTVTHAYLDFRALTPEEQAVYTAANKPVPLLTPVFVITGISNVAGKGVITPPIILDTLAAISTIKDADLITLFDQCAQYQTSIDKSCSTYDWNQVTMLLGKEVMARGMTVPDLKPIPPQVFLTRTDKPSPAQVQTAYAAAFAPLQIAIDTPQSGEQAKVRNALITNLNYYHLKITNKVNAISSPQWSTKSGILTPQGSYGRVSSTSEGRRDVREKMNALGLAAEFLSDGTGLENFENGILATDGIRIGDDTPSHQFLRSYNFVSEVMFPCGTYEIETERQRTMFSREYLDQLVAHLGANNVTFKIKHSAQAIINNSLSGTATTDSLGSDDLY